MRYTARPASADDLDQVAEIEKKTIRPPWSREAFAAELGRKTSHFWVLTDDETDEKVIAYAVFSFPAEQAHLVTFAVHPQFRRQGHGAYLLRQLIAFVMRRKGESIALEVRKSNSAAIQLYQALGFVVIRSVSRCYPDGEDGYSMIYKIERDKPTGDPDVDFDGDPVEPGAGGKQNLN